MRFRRDSEKHLERQERGQWGIALASVAGEALSASVEMVVVWLARASLVLARSKVTNQVF